MRSRFRVAKDKILSHGIRAKFKIGKVTQPWEIKRTDAIQDLIKQADKEADMKLMSLWRNWSQRQYDRWGSKLQEKYDAIAGMKLSPELQKLLEALAGVLSPAVVAKFMKYVLKTKKFADGLAADNAEEILKKVLKKIKEAL